MGVKAKLPAGWERKKIGDITDVSTGGTPKTGHLEYYGGDIRWLKSGDIKGTYIFDVPNRISDLGLQNSNARIHPAGSVMIALSGQGKTRGTSAILKVPSACSQSVAAILPTPHAIPEIIHYALVYLYEDIRRITGDNERTGLNLKIIRDIEIPIPRVEEQLRIVEWLNKQLEAVERARAAAEEQTNVANSLFYSTLNNLFYMKNKWRECRLKEISKIVRGSSPRPKGDPRYYGSGVPRLMVEDVTRDGMYVTPRVDSLTIEGAKLSRPMKRGEVVMVVSGAPGLPGILDVDACIHDGFVGFRDLRTDVILPEFLYFFLTYTKDQTDAQATGAIFRNLTTDQVGELIIPIPPIHEQRKIVERLKDKFQDSRNLTDHLKSQKYLIDSLPMALYKHAFSGDI